MVTACPFCKANDWVYRTKAVYTDNAKMRTECNKCGISGPWARTHTAEQGSTHELSKNEKEYSSRLLALALNKDRPWTFGVKPERLDQTLAEFMNRVPHRHFKSMERRKRLTFLAVASKTKKEASKMFTSRELEVLEGILRHD